MRLGNVSRAQMRLSGVSQSGWGECNKGLSNNTTRALCLYAFPIKLLFQSNPITLLQLIKFVIISIYSLEITVEYAHPLTLRNNLLP